MTDPAAKIDTSVYGDRRPIMAEVVALLHVTFPDRGLKLIETKSRALRVGDIHELMLTDEDSKPGDNADHVRVVCFFEVKQGGLAVTGDKVTIHGEHVGVVAGWDMTHMPNHMNFLVKCDSLDKLQVSVGEKLTVKMP
jgi:hypothetical protein